MADVTNLPHPDDDDPDCRAGDDQFLLNEGLDLLAAFRAIREPLIRAAVLTIVKSLAADHPSETAS